jgi:hypothetical protein
MPTNAEPKTYPAPMAWAMLGFTLLLCSWSVWAGVAVGWALYLISVRHSGSRARYVLVLWLLALTAASVASLASGHHLTVRGIAVF